MTSFHRLAFALLLVATMSALAEGQTVLFDFQDLDDPFGNFGTITTDSGLLPDCGTVGNVCDSHTGSFTESPTSPHEIGLIEIGPGTPPLAEGEGIDLSAYVGYSIDARFIRDTDGMGGEGLEVFTGLSRIKMGLQWEPTDSCNGSMDACSDLYTPEVELTETFTTYTVMFADLNLPPAADLADVQLKMLMLTGEFNSALAPNRKLNSADFNASGSVGGDDFLTWQRSFGTAGVPAGFAEKFIDGNANYDDVFDAADLDIWKSQYDTDAPIGDFSNGIGRLEFDNIIGILPPASSLANTVPEPRSCWLILSSGFFLLTRNTRLR